MIQAVENIIGKDTVLDKLGDVANVAQFVSYSPDLKQRHSRVSDFEPNYFFDSLNCAARELLKASTDKSVNVRSYTPESPKSREFIYGLTNADDVVNAVKRLADEGLYTIINETIDINDGGVSGVILGDIIEFSPKDTPRSVEKPGTASLPRKLGLKLLETVYKFRPDLDFPKSNRVEFSIHPIKRGFRHDHTIVWEMEEVGETNICADIKWSNNFSKFIGDKAYGLLIAHLIGLNVPSTLVISRNIAPFRYGSPTNSSEFWIRTCPTEQVPGKFTTHRGWIDPFKLMYEEDPDGLMIASVLSQEGIEAVYSGALVTSASGEVIIEGVKGYGDDFMLGTTEKSEIPFDVKESVLSIYKKAKDKLGFVRMEWVFDGERVWTVQLHKGATVSEGSIIYPGSASYYHKFEVKNGLSELRDLIAEIKSADEGIELIGNVGITSHLGDVLRKAEIPSRIVSL